MTEPRLIVTYEVVAYLESGYGDNRSKVFEIETDAVNYAKSLPSEFFAIVQRRETMAPVVTRINWKGRPMTDARCEPPPELRGKDGDHWVQFRDETPQIARWQHEGIWLGIGPGNTPASAEWAYREGFRYLSPALTPAEVAALRAERDAAVAENHRLKTGNKLLADAVRSWGWENRKQESNGELIGRALWEQHDALTTLRAEVEKLRGALDKFGFGTDLDAHLKLTGALIDMEHKPEAPPDRVCWATLNRVVAQLQAARAVLEPKP